ncbi:MAG: FecR domain-containing protein [Pseudomonadota bacterium]
MLDEAAALFLKLQEHPEDIDRRRARDAFLARGPAARDAYRTIARAYEAAAPPRRSRPLTALVVALALIITGAGAAPVLRTHWLADVATDLAPMTIALASGDRAHLDATSALADDTEGAMRAVTLLDGAAFFTVARDTRPFIVKAGALEAEALGTAFEVAIHGASTVVTVLEGSVAVRIGAQSWRLSAGEQIRASEDGAVSRHPIRLDAVASWRSDRLVAEGMSFAEVAAILDRRLAGPVFVLDEELAAATVTGGFDLTRPLSALRILAAARQGSVIAAPPLATLVLATR